MAKKRFTPARQRAACEAHQARANQRATKFAPIVEDIQAAGVTSLNGIASGSTLTFASRV
jgi:hypothetical protein